jgi:hypothetical protein
MNTENAECTKDFFVFSVALFRGCFVFGCGSGRFVMQHLSQETDPVWARPGLPGKR